MALAGYRKGKHPEVKWTFLGRLNLPVLSTPYFLLEWPPQNVHLDAADAIPLCAASLLRQLHRMTGISTKLSAYRQYGPFHIRHESVGKLTELLFQTRYVASSEARSALSRLVLALKAIPRT